MKKIIGYYHNKGYEICGIDKNGQIVNELYQAGNNRFDSQQNSADNPLPLSTLKRYCKQTGEEIAKENGLPFIGVELMETN